MEIIPGSRLCRFGNWDARLLIVGDMSLSGDAACSVGMALLSMMSIGVCSHGKFAISVLHSCSLCKDCGRAVPGNARRDTRRAANHTMESGWPAYM